MDFKRISNRLYRESCGVELDGKKSLNDPESEIYIHNIGGRDACLNEKS
jgi:hypothetical protein